MNHTDSHSYTIYKRNLVTKLITQPNKVNNPFNPEIASHKRILPHS